MKWLRNVIGRAAEAREDAPEPQSQRDWKAEGNAALAAGQFAEAASCYERGLQAAPGDAALRLNLGFVLLEMGQPAAAAGRLAHALQASRPGDPLVHEAHYLLARARRQLGDAVAALASLREAIAIRPDFTPALQEGTGLLQELQRNEEAFEWAQRWAQAETTPESLLSVGYGAYLLGRHDEAIGALDALLAAQPGHVAALEGRALVRLALGSNEQALADFDAAIQAGASGAAVRAGRASALRRCGRPEEALQEIEQVLALDPEHRDALAEKGGLLIELLRVQEAARTLDEALALHPDDADLRWGRATARLLTGDMERGWADYEIRTQAPSAGLKFAPPDYGAPRWTGSEPLAGKSVLVLTEQGLGDALQFARYIPLLQERGARVTFHALPALHTILGDAFPGCSLVSGGTIREPDFQCLLMSLPLAFGTTVATVPTRVPYLRSRPELRASWETRLGPRRGLRVGLVWSGGTLFGNDAKRSIPLEVFRAIDCPGVQFVSLQKELRERDRAAFEAWPGLQHFGDQLQSFADTAALADLMDMVVSVDTSVAHLAGGLGRPLWVLLPHVPDWRWMVGRIDSPWYPTARLFRQSSPGDWPGVLQQVREDLAKLAATAPA